MSITLQMTRHTAMEATKQGHTQVIARWEGRMDDGQNVPELAWLHLPKPQTPATGQVVRGSSVCMGMKSGDHRFLQPMQQNRCTGVICVVSWHSLEKSVVLLFSPPQTHDRPTPLRHGLRHMLTFSKYRRTACWSEGKPTQS